MMEQKRTHIMNVIAVVTGVLTILGMDSEVEAIKSLIEANSGLLAGVLGALGVGVSHFKSKSNERELGLKRKLQEAEDKPQRSPPDIEFDEDALTLAIDDLKPETTS